MKSAGCSSTGLAAAAPTTTAPSVPKSSAPTAKTPVFQPRQRGASVTTENIRSAAPGGFAVRELKGDGPSATKGAGEMTKRSSKQDADDPEHLSNLRKSLTADLQRQLSLRAGQGEVPPAPLTSQHSQKSIKRNAPPLPAITPSPIPPPPSNALPKERKSGIAMMMRAQKDKAKAEDGVVNLRDLQNTLKKDDLMRSMKEFKEGNVELSVPD